MQISKTELPDTNAQMITPDNKYNWLNQPTSDFARLLPLIPRKLKGDTTKYIPQGVFSLAANAAKSNRDEWVYDFSKDSLTAKAKYFVDTYNTTDTFIGIPQMPDDVEGDVAIKWSHTLQGVAAAGQKLRYSRSFIMLSPWRPYVVKHFYADRMMNDRLTGHHYAMFGSDLQRDNRAINFCALGKDFYALATDMLPNYSLLSTTYTVPLYRYTADGERVSNITQWGLDQINAHYREAMGGGFAAAFPKGITAEQVFAYTYAVLHDPVYRHDYALDLKQEFPRLPLYRDFAAWAAMGQELLDLHIGFETAEPYPLRRSDAPSARGGAPKAILRADKESGVIRLDSETTLTGVPADAWRYVLGSRSALEWILDQYKEKTPRDPTIRERFNTYRFADHKERVIELLRRVCTVSVRTMEIVDSMAYWDGGQLVVWDDREHNDLADLAMWDWARRDDDPQWEAVWSET